MPLDDRSEVLDGTLPAQWAGIDFHMPDTSTAPGRRVAEFLFPGIDAAAYDDHGEAPEEVTITGILLGDDYRSQAQRLRQKMKSPGPKQLIHPWLGGMTTIMDVPGEITFSDRELRVARFYMSLKVMKSLSSGASRKSTTSRVRGLAGQLSSSAIQLAQTPSPVLTKAINRTRRLTEVAFPDYTQSTNEAFPIGFNTWLVKSTTSSVVTSSPVTAAAEASAVTSIDPDQLMDTVLQGAESLLKEVSEAPSPTDIAQLTAVSALALAETTNLALYVSFTSRSHAYKIRDRLSGNLQALQTSAPFALSASTMARFQSATSAVSRYAKQLNSALHDDINEVVGRLPRLHIITLDRPTDAFLVAHHLYGDTPSEVERAYRSIVERNQPRHPAQLPAGKIEVER